MLLSFFPWILYLIAWGFSLYAMQHGAPLWLALMHYVVIFNGGFQGLWGALGHLAFPKQTAQKIGWQSNGFQAEIGFTNLGIGVTGLCTYFFPVCTAGIALFIIIFYAG